MIPVMSGDRMSAYRIFQGEIDRMIALRGGRENFSDTDIVVINYIEARMKEMEEKGHGWKD